MLSDTKPTRDQNIRLPVHVAIYEHPHGTDVRVFLNREEALSWRTRIAQGWWSNAFDDDPPPEEQIGEEYFERMLERDEFFSTMACEIDGGHHQPSNLISPAPNYEGGGAS
ncbi:hypothetical protein [Albidovulum sp.]|uniref:hypothetical protein n=1 Tax=Albidovulum sp. TaxID=1872424 RepID=UPI0039B9AAB1